MLLIKKLEQKFVTLIWYSKASHKDKIKQAIKKISKKKQLIMLGYFSRKVYLFTWLFCKKSILICMVILQEKYTYLHVWQNLLSKDDNLKN